MKSGLLELTTDTSDKSFQMMMVMFLKGDGDDADPDDDEDEAKLAADSSSFQSGSCRPLPALSQSPSYSHDVALHAQKEQAKLRIRTLCMVNREIFQLVHVRANLQWI